MSMLFTIFGYKGRDWYAFDSCEAREKFARENGLAIGGERASFEYYGHTLSIEQFRRAVEEAVARQLR